MALNPYHTFEELEGIKCSTVEKNCNTERAEFLKKLLELNGFTVVLAKSPPPKIAAKPASDPAPPVIEPLPLPETFTLGVTDLSFSYLNAIYNRELLTSDGKVVTPDYWKQLNPISEEDTWYWKNNE